MYYTEAPTLATNWIRILAYKTLLWRLNCSVVMASNMTSNSKWVENKQGQSRNKQNHSYNNHTSYYLFLGHRLKNRGRKGGNNGILTLNHKMKTVFWTSYTFKLNYSQFRAWITKIKPFCPGKLTANNCEYDHLGG